MDEYEKIKEVRMQLKLSQADFASAVGVSQKDVSKMERGQKKFIPKEYILFLSDKNYDINTLFNDELPLKKVGDPDDFAAEPSADYRLNSDLELINKALKAFGFTEKEQFARFIDQHSEKEGQANSLFDLAVINAWKKEFLPKFEWMERKLLIMTELIMNDAQSDIEKLKEELQKKDSI
ncbi:helix-turn-helix transcriptional regulator [Zobellia galactanivorans]|uniref:helix-turn-helix domain-containing protein n=1 Tax=Zobellia galactanivorans (strain DSM 12802 / CCUG 47099 / CIP 106680 / NCIMB 13871 / Dsij) TaxID=63186 RepID=UPI0026E23A69|nr:helix-turn-helix transcriptional regulator [Zobellia galactanivorans]MDO6808122.1 helix-turn-helix transcriptional regulator [Zobellia galactanivorans]